MSADRIFYYAPQRVAVFEFMANIGGIVSARSPHGIAEANELDGLDHITFIVIDGHPEPIPQRMWERIVDRGAIVIHVDDQYSCNRLVVRRVSSASQGWAG